MVKVLVVEDEASIREVIALNLRRSGMEVLEAGSAEVALACWKPAAPKRGSPCWNRPPGAALPFWM